jgi:DNA-binding response OmpR family regulator
VANQVLIVDSDEAFATILKEGIEMGGEYRASIVTTAADARNTAARGRLAMAIVDMGLEDADPIELLQNLRERDPEIRLMVIPLDKVPDEVVGLGIQGTLTKPFFLPDIPAQIDGALSRPVGILATEPEPSEIVIETPVEVIHLANESQRLTSQLRFLSRELNADAVLLTYGAELLAYAGNFNRADAERLAQVVSESWLASARVAAALGREQVRFEQSLHEGEDYLLYSVAATADIVLSVALRADRPLGMIRYNTKQTAQELESILLPR